MSYTEYIQITVTQATRIIYNDIETPLIVRNRLLRKAKLFHLPGFGIFLDNVLLSDSNLLTLLYRLIIQTFLSDFKNKFVDHLAELIIFPSNHPKTIQKNNTAF